MSVAATLTDSSGLRSSPTPEGRCWVGGGGGGGGEFAQVAILADPGGPVLAPGG